MERFQQLPMFTPSGKKLRCSATNTNQDSTRHRLCRPLEGYICGITQCSKVLGHTGTDRAHTARDKAKNVTPEEHELGLQRFHVYREWLLKEALRVHERNPILVWPIKVVEPNYRDEVPKNPQTGDQLLSDPLLLAPVLGAPELVVPIGEIGYQSRISQREEPLPVCVAVMGLPGMTFIIPSWVCGDDLQIWFADYLLS